MYICTQAERERERERDVPRKLFTPEVVDVRARLCACPDNLKSHTKINGNGLGFRVEFIYQQTRIFPTQRH